MSKIKLPPVPSQPIQCDQEHIDDMWHHAIERGCLKDVQWLAQQSLHPSPFVSLFHMSEPISWARCALQYLQTDIFKWLISSPDFLKAFEEDFKKSQEHDALHSFIRVRPEREYNNSLNEIWVDLNYHEKWKNENESFLDFLDSFMPIMLEKPWVNQHNQTIAHLILEKNLFKLSFFNPIPMGDKNHEWDYIQSWLDWVKEKPLVLKVLGNSFEDGNRKYKSFFHYANFEIKKQLERPRIDAPRGYENFIKGFKTRLDDLEKVHERFKLDSALPKALGTRNQKHL